MKMTVARMFYLLPVIFLIPNVAWAANWNSAHGSVIGNDLCDIAGSMVGELAAGIATIAICSLGTMACLGRVQWMTVIVVAIGVVIMFGAVSIAGAVGSALGTAAVDAKGGCT